MNALLARALAGLLLLGGLYAAWTWQQHQLDETRRALTTATDRVTALERDLKEAKTKERVVTRYVDRVQIVREAARTIEKRIPVYVTEKANDRCQLPVGFVRVHDAAAQGLPLADPAGDPDAPAAGLTLAAVADTVAGNYESCHDIREQLIALQDYERSKAAPE